MTKKRSTKTSERAVSVPQTQTVKISELNPHPRNFRGHPDDQIVELMQSIRDHGFVKNIVVARDTILGGHGIVAAADRLGMEEVPAVVLDIDPMSPMALKFVAADNMLSTKAEDDDRLLTELLREIQQSDQLLGTGVDDRALAALVMVTRPAHEISDFDAAAEWVGMPDFEHEAIMQYELRVFFDTAEERAEVAAGWGYDERTIRNTSGKIWSGHWPPKRRDDLQAVEWVSDIEEEPAPAV